MGGFFVVEIGLRLVYRWLEGIEDEVYLRYGLEQKGVVFADQRGVCARSKLRISKGGCLSFCVIALGFSKKLWRGMRCY